jgi:ATP-dependent Lon protease
MDQTQNPQQKVSDVLNVPVAQANFSASDELGEIEELAKKVKESKLPEGLREKALKMVNRLRRMAKFGSYSGEYELIDRYIDWIISVPWGEYTQDNLDIQNARQILDKHHYGLIEVKNRILEFLAVAKLNPYEQIKTKSQQQSEEKQPSQEGYEKMGELKGSSQNAPILCFVGIQGIGKTSMAKSIALALGRKFVRISLGAMGSVTDLKGQSRAFLDAEPGQVIKSLVRTKVMNPLVLLDEIDKVSAAEGRRADINAALLEILDPEQNHSFQDSYIDYPVNLSGVLFITTANTLSTLSAALLDRLEIIRFSSYSDEEKEQIGKHYILPKVLKATGLKSEQVQIQEEVWPLIIRPLGFDAGVRQLERNITTICRRIARSIVEGRGEYYALTPENFRSFLPADIGVYS